MKKLVIAIALLVLILVIAPWGVGRLAEARVNKGLDKLVETAPYLKVVDRKYTVGWFKSQQEVTFEISAPWMQAMSPKVLEDAMKKQGEEGAAPEANAAASGADETKPDAEAPPHEADTASADAPAKPEEPLRFTVHNDILHGPVLGLSGFGVARVDSHLVLSDKIRKEIEEIFGPKDPIEVSTRVRFFGGGTTTFTSEGRTIKPKGEKNEISWDTFKLALGYSTNADKYDVDGKWPRLEVKGLEDKTHFTMTGFSMDGDGKRVRGDLYDGAFKMGIDKIVATDKTAEVFEVDGIHYIVDSDSSGDFSSISAKLGSGEVKVKQLADLGIALKEVHYDFGVRRLHTETLVKLMSEMKAMYSTPLTNVAEVDKVMFAPLKKQGAELLKYDPEFVFDRLGIVTGDGDGFLKGVISLKGATADDFAPGSMSIIAKIHADLTVDVSEKMLQKFPNGSAAAGAAVDSGYAKREGDRLICKIIFADGKLTVNGKPQAIPGLGGPPPPQE